MGVQKLDPSDLSSFMSGRRGFGRGPGVKDGVVTRDYAAGWFCRDFDVKFLYRCFAGFRNADDHKLRDEVLDRGGSWWSSFEKVQWLLRVASDEGCSFKDRLLASDRLDALRFSGALCHSGLDVLRGSEDGVVRKRGLKQGGKEVDTSVEDGPALDFDGGLSVLGVGGDRKSVRRSS